MMKKMLALLLVLVMVAPTAVWGQQVPVIHTDTTRETQPQIYFNGRISRNRYHARTPCVILHGGRVWAPDNTSSTRSLPYLLGARLIWFGYPQAGYGRYVFEGREFLVPRMQLDQGFFIQEMACLETVAREVGVRMDVNVIENTIRFYTGLYQHTDQIRPVRISEPTFFSQEELRELIRYAYPAYLTIPSRPHPNRRMNQQELEEWIEGFWVLGINREELQMLYYVNAARVRYGSRPAKLCPYRSMAARLYAQLIIEGHQPNIAHMDTIYGGPTDRVRIFNPALQSSENVAGATDPYHAVRSLLNSPAGHRRNLLQDNHESMWSFGHGNLGRGNVQKMGPYCM